MLSTSCDLTQSPPGSDLKRMMTTPGGKPTEKKTEGGSSSSQSGHPQQHEQPYPYVGGGQEDDIHDTRGSGSPPDPPPRLQLVFDGLSVVQKKKTVISGACGLLKSGELTAVVSCCGARGDYYLLNALAGHIDSTGTVLANGTPVTSERYLRTAAMIDDDRTSLGELTVRQNVQFSAEMRVADYTTNSRRVEAVLEALGLDDVANKELRRCSPFVRRRVCVAKELVLSPEFVYVDSAIEGLPTHEAKRLLEMLRTLAVEQHIVVVTSMVQPRFTFLEMVDSVLLLEGTNMVYLGPVLDVIAPQLSGGIGGGGGVSSSGLVVPEAALNNLYRTATSPDASLKAMFLHHPNTLKAMHEGAQVIGQAARGELFLDAAGSSRSARKDPFSVAKFAFMCKYSLLAVKNNVTTYIAYTMAPLFVAVLLAAIYTSQSGQVGMQNRIGIIFFLISGTFLHNMLFVDVKRQDFVSFQRLRAQGYYGPATYLTFLLVTSAAVRFLCCFVFTLVVYSLSNIEEYWNLNSLKDLVFIVALTSFSSHILVWFVCCLVPSTRIAHFLLFAVYAFNTILAGIILNVNTLPKPFQVMSFGSLIRLGYESAVVTQFTNQTFGCGLGTHLHDGIMVNNTAESYFSSSLFSGNSTESYGLRSSATGGHAGVEAATGGFAQRAAELAGAVLSTVSSSSSFSSGSLSGRSTSDSSTSSSSSSFSSAKSTGGPGGEVTWANGGHVSTHSCYTGDEYMAFLGFSNDRRWSNLQVMAFFTTLGVLGSYIVMTARKPTSKW